jgi:hypothetical protein
MSEMDDFGYDDEGYDDDELLEGFDDIDAEGDAEFALDGAESDDDEMLA